MAPRRFSRIAATATAAFLIGAASIVISPLSATAAGVGDTSGAVLYGASGPVGSVLSGLTDSDDGTTTIPIPFPINFFGTKYDFLCVASNGTATPVATAGDSCNGDYDVNLANAATDQGASIIGALLADDDPSEELWKSATPIATIEASGGVLTVTTTTPNTFAVGDDVEAFISPDDPDLGSSPTLTVATVISPTQFTVVWAGADIASRAVTGGWLGLPYDNATDDTNADGLADDGFGDVKNVYAGATTFGGQPAFAITWYRVPTNDTDNLPSKSNTFQLVFVQKPTTLGPTAGYDFDAQFNFGTLTDDSDGYDPADPSSSCDSTTPVDCRWSVGWAQWDGATATPFELFADAPVSEIVDPGSKALVKNSLNSSVLGRYTFAMVDGATVSFAVPPLDGTTTAGAPTLAATGVSAPEFVFGGGLLLAGAVLLLVGRPRRSSRHLAY